MNRRIERINALLREEIAVLLTREVKDPRLGTMVSITGVETSPDLRNATVKVSVLGSREETEEAMAGLRHAAGYLRREMAARLKLRQVPELSFRLDRSIEEGARVLELLREIDGDDGGE
jgi:ribosome-binding factor A